MEEKKIDTEKTLKCLSTLYQDDPDKLKILKDFIEKEEFYIDVEGQSKMSSEFIYAIHKIDLIKATSKRICLEILISFTNYLNNESDKKYLIKDKIIKGLSLKTVSFIKFAILNKNNIDFWQNVEEDIKNYE